MVFEGMEGGEMITYKQAELKQTDTIANLGMLLYSSDNTFETLQDEAVEHLQSENWTVFLAFDANIPVGMCEISLRTDYVEGTEGGTVGYVEGVFVQPEYRGRHIAKELISCGETWAREMGCAEFASDCKLENTDSLHFHLGVGFEEAGRNIHFVKKL